MNGISRPVTVVIGAGPYGLSAAAHLQATGTDLRVFGKPVNRWRCQMPEGMFLKSEGFASSLSDPEGSATLERFCADRGYPYADRGIPVPIDVFVEYALWFQRRFAPDTEETMVQSVERLYDGRFNLRLEDGSRLKAGKVIVATGLEHTTFVPPAFSNLPKELFTHSSEHRSLARFHGKDVTIIGAGQSALETAALLAEQGASVRVLVRKPVVKWNETPQLERSFFDRLSRPVSGLGEGYRLLMFSRAPMVYRRFRQDYRLKTMKSVLDAAGSWWLRERIEGHVQISTGCTVSKADNRGGRALLRAIHSDGKVEEIVTDHVIAATGYQFDLHRLPFLTADIKSRIQLEARRPILSRNFESSVSGMYFVGFATANTFGPVMRFIDGVGCAARTVAHHIAVQYGSHKSPAGVEVPQMAR